MTSTVKPTRVRITDAGDSIRRREPFLAGDGSLSGGYAVHVRPFDSEAARMPADALTRYGHALRQTHAIPRALYVVRSYGTPIAWAAPGEALTVPAVSYSVTTSRHQSIARRASF